MKKICHEFVSFDLVHHRGNLARFQLTLTLFITMKFALVAQFNSPTSLHRQIMTFGSSAYLIRVLSILDSREN